MVLERCIRYEIPRDHSIFNVPAAMPTSCGFSRGSPLPRIRRPAGRPRSGSVKGCSGCSDLRVTAPLPHW